METIKSSICDNTQSQVSSVDCRGSEAEPTIAQCHRNPTNGSTGRSISPDRTNDIDKNSLTIVSGSVIENTANDGQQAEYQIGSQMGPIDDQHLKQALDRRCIRSDTDGKGKQRLGCPQLPTETWEQIIDFVAVPDAYPYDRGIAETMMRLARCALVCKDWLARSRFHLYQNPGLGGSSQNASFLDSIRQFPQTPSPFAITHMTLVPAVSPDEIPESNLTHAKARGFHVIPLLLANHPHYTSSIIQLTIESYDVWTGPSNVGPPDDSPCHASFLMSCRRTFSSVTTLRLDCLRLTSFSFLARLLGSLISLESLSLISINSTKKEYRPPKFTHHKRLHLRRISVMCSDITVSFVRWCIKGCAPRELQSLSLQLSDEDAPDAYMMPLQKLLNHASVALTYLELSLRNADIREEFAPLTFHLNVNLHTLVISSSSVRNVQRLVSEISSSNVISEMKFQFGIDQEAKPQGVCSLLGAISPKTFSKLNRVTIGLTFAEHWVIRGSCKQRSKERAAIQTDLLEKSKELRHALKKRDGGLVVAIEETHGEAREVATTVEDEYSDDDPSENHKSGRPRHDRDFGMFYRKLDRLGKRYIKKDRVRIRAEELKKKAIPNERERNRSESSKGS